jgi:hypothetical protein
MSDSGVNCPTLTFNSIATVQKCVLIKGNEFKGNEYLPFTKASRPATEMVLLISLHLECPGPPGGKFMVGAVAFTYLAQENKSYGSCPQTPGVPSEQ